MNDLTLWSGHQDSCPPPLTDVWPRALCRVGCGPAISRGLAPLTRGGGGGRCGSPPPLLCAHPPLLDWGLSPAATLTLSRSSPSACCALTLCTGPATSHDRRAGRQALSHESVHQKVQAFFLFLSLPNLQPFVFPN